jgi:hypothetical protein
MKGGVFEQATVWTVSLTPTGGLPLKGEEAGVFLIIYLGK